jgi:hypothetical protein
MKFLEKIGNFLSNLLSTKQSKIELEYLFIEEKEVEELDKIDPIEEPKSPIPSEETIESVGEIKSKSRRKPDPKNTEEPTEKKPSKPKSRKYRPRKKKEGE